MFSVVSLICPVVNMLLLVKCSYFPRKVGFVVDMYNDSFLLQILYYQYTNLIFL